MFINNNIRFTQLRQVLAKTIVIIMVLGSVKGGFNKNYTIKNKTFRIYNNIFCIFTKMITYQYLVKRYTCFVSFPVEI